MFERKDSVLNFFFLSFVASIDVFGYLQGSRISTLHTRALLTSCAKNRGSKEITIYGNIASINYSENFNFPTIFQPFDKVYKSTAKKLDCIYFFFAYMLLCDVAMFTKFR